MKKAIGIVALILSVASAFWIVGYMKQSIEQENMMNALQEMHDAEETQKEETEQEKEDAEPEKKEEEAASGPELPAIDPSQDLKKINRDYVGWIKIEGTKINYPVVQCIQNLWYLDHDFYRNKSPYGTPFLDANADLKTSQNLVVYAHNMSDGQMFTDLMQYEDQSFYEEHRFITFLGKTYEIFAAERVDLFEDAAIAVAYTGESYFSQDYFLDFIKEVREKSAIETDVEVNENDRILSLSTCTWAHEDERFVVFAKLIEDKK